MIIQSIPTEIEYFIFYERVKELSPVRGLKCCILFVLSKFAFPRFNQFVEAVTAIYSEVFFPFFLNIKHIFIFCLTFFFFDVIHFFFRQAKARTYFAS